MRSLKSVFFGLILIFTPVSVSALEIENSKEMPHPLNTKFIEEVWQEVIRIYNDKSIWFDVDAKHKPPKIVYLEAPPDAVLGSRPKLAEIGCTDNKEEINLKCDRTIWLYRDAFYEHFPEWKKTAPVFFAEQAYGALAQEFFHEALLHNPISTRYHHCAMINWDVLIKATQFIDVRMSTGPRVANAIVGYTKGQCEKESGGRIKFP